MAAYAISAVFSSLFAMAIPARHAHKEGLCGQMHGEAFSHKAESKAF